MDGNKNPQYNGSSPQRATGKPELISVEHVQRLVRLLDGSDVSEVEITNSVQRTRLVLRKAKAPTNGQPAEQSVLLHPVQSQSAEEVSAPASTEHKVVAPLVGIFHSWAKPKGGSLVAVGDHVKAGQLVATIQSLNLLNEVEAPMAGRVTEILVQDGQPVEYGQPLMVIDSKEDKEDR
jgi:acetyl-CoA carboxylase biotin carboxyl carrier protein